MHLKNGQIVNFTLGLIYKNKKNNNIGKKPDKSQKSHIVCVSMCEPIFKKYPEEANPQKQKADWGLQGEREITV